jgi:hypothetical protein
MEEIKELQDARIARPGIERESTASIAHILASHPGQTHVMLYREFFIDGSAFEFIQFEFAVTFYIRCGPQERHF